MIRYDDVERRIDLGVHDLIESGPPSGHLALQVAWSARARMRAGQEAHTAWQSAQAVADEAYRAEVVIRHRVMIHGWEVLISGRLDGLTQEGHWWVAEEIKSTAIPEERLRTAVAADFPGWIEQLQVYLFFLGAEGREAVGRLVVVSLADGSKHLMHVSPDPGMGARIEAWLGWIVHEHEGELAWRARRRSVAARGIPFAHPTWRDGQQELATQLSTAIAAERRVILQAPTGYGKTAAALHAAIDTAWRSDRRVFFATARTTQQRMAEETLRQMAARGLPLRAVSIRAREKICLNEVVACRPESCRFAAGYYDKLREREPVRKLWPDEQDDFGPGAGGTLGMADPDAVVRVAEPDELCPFALSLDMAARADVVVGDYNYAFDPAMRLSFMTEDPGNWIIVVDEAHNLPDRAMGYGSPEIRLGVAEQAVATLFGSAGGAVFAEAAQAVVDWLSTEIGRVPPGAREGEAAFSLEEGLDRRTVRAMAEHFDALAMEYAMWRHQRGVVPQGEADPWMDCARAVLRLRSALERAGPETVVIWRRVSGGGGPRGQLSLLSRGGEGEGSGLKLLCRDPSGIVGPFHRDLGGLVLMSATLHPAEFFRDILGLEEAKVEVQTWPSPFPPEHRRVLLVPEISTLYRDRQRDRGRTAELVSQIIAAVPGNIAVYFSSFAHRDLLLPAIDLGGRPALVQDRSMGERARSALLETMGRAEGHVLLGVLGGIFSEGIDLPGDALLAAVIVGPALPAATLERKLLQQWMEERFEQGFRYAWLVPGMGRVVQAAGRVIRSPGDRGAVVLLCRRFVQKDYRSFFPEEWAPLRTADPAAELTAFWPEG